MGGAQNGCAGRRDPSKGAWTSPDHSDSARSIVVEHCLQQMILRLVPQVTKVQMGTGKVYRKGRSGNGR